MSELGGEELDASLLLLGLHDYADPASPRMRSTGAAIRASLGAGGGLLYRRPAGDDDAHAREGAFGICSFWSVELRARQGEIAEAVTGFEALLAYANDVGLFGEQIDPASGATLGNFPQAFTHIGLINAALALEGRRATESPAPVVAAPAEELE